MIKNRLISIAPMMGYTNRHYRTLMRLISRHVLLYTEMITCNTLLYGNATKILSNYSVPEHPLALQLGGADPQALTECARMAEQHGYQEVNLNVGCPSPRVQSGTFGACLFKTPKQVARCVSAIQTNTNLPVTVKTRIGVDDHDHYHHLYQFIDIVAAAGCQVFILHARKAWLKGLNPKQNRSIPKLDYETVYRIKSDFPHLTIITNGGISTLDAIDKHLQHTDGVMIGRAAYHHPLLLLQQIDTRYFGDKHNHSPHIHTILHNYATYMKRQQEKDVPFHHMSRHLAGLLKGLPHAKYYRQQLKNSDHFYQWLDSKSLMQNITPQ